MKKTKEWEKLNIDSRLISAINKMKYEKPTNIQKKVN
jgi:superfamily II DNA/RNA helicase